MILQDGEPLFSRRCTDERGARYVADCFRKDTLKAGWVEATPNATDVLPHDVEETPQFLAPRLLARQNQSFSGEQLRRAAHGSEVLGQEFGLSFRRIVGPENGMCPELIDAPPDSLRAIVHAECRSSCTGKPEHDTLLPQHRASAGTRQNLPVIVDGHPKSECIVAPGQIVHCAVFPEKRVKFARRRRGIADDLGPFVDWRRNDRIATERSQIDHRTVIKKESTGSSRYIEYVADDLRAVIDVGGLEPGRGPEIAYAAMFPQYSVKGARRIIDAHDLPAIIHRRGAALSGNADAVRERAEVDDRAVLPQHRMSGSGPGRTFADYLSAIIDVAGDRWRTAWQRAEVENAAIFPRDSVEICEQAVAEPNGTPAVIDRERLTEVPWRQHRQVH